MHKPSIRLTTAICAAALAIGTTLPAGAEPIDLSQFRYAFNVTFPGYTGTGALENFPVLIKFSEGNGSGFLYSLCEEDGSDIRFLDSENNLLPHEIDTWNPSGTSLVWVSVPSLDRTTTIKVCYGSYTPPSPLPSTDVWTNGYVAVWHLNAEETSIYQYDSTMNALTLTAATPDDVLCVTGGVAGIVGFAAEFNKGSDGKHKGAYYHVDNDGTLSGFSAYTFELWSFQNDHDPAVNNGAVYFSNCRYNHSDYVFKMQEYNGSDSRSGMSIFHSYANNASSSNQTYGDTGDIIPAANIWNYQAFAIDANSRRVFLNDRKIKNSSSGYPPLRYSAGASEGADVHFWLGNSHSNNHDAYPGKLDEVRISNVSRSDDWVKATYDTVKTEGFAKYEEIALRNDWSKYKHRFAVTFSAYEGSELTNFPALVKLDESLDAFSYAYCEKENGGDLRFADADGNILPSEVDCWNTNGVSCVWVKVPRLDSNTKIVGYCGWKLAPQETPAEVWDSNYVAVWHLGGAADATTQTDSTANAIVLTEYQPNNIKSVEAGVPGIVGNAAQFGIRGDLHGCYGYNDATFLLTGPSFSAFTFEIWSWQNDHDPQSVTNDYFYFRHIANNWSPTAYQMKEENGKGRTNFSANYDNNTSGSIYNSNELNPLPARASWNYHAIAFDSTKDTRKLFLNDINLKSTTDNTGTLLSEATESFFWLGNGHQWDAHAFPGKLDEVRISNIARSDDWVKATYDTIAGNLAKVVRLVKPTQIVLY